MKKIIFLFSFLFISLQFAYSQSDNLAGHWVGYALVFDTDTEKYYTISIELKIILKGTKVIASSFDSDEQGSYSIMAMSGDVVNKKLFLRGNKFIKIKNSTGVVHLLPNYELELIGAERLEGLVYLKYNDDKNNEDYLSFKVFLHVKSNVVTPSELYSYNDQSWDKIKIKINDYFLVNKSLEEKLVQLEKKATHKIMPTTLPFVNRNTELVANKPQSNITTTSSIPTNVNNNKVNFKILAQNNPSRVKKNVTGLIREVIKVDLDTPIILDNKMIDYWKNTAKKNSNIRDIQHSFDNLKSVETLYKFSFIDTPIYMFVYSNSNVGDTISFAYKNDLLEPYLVLDRIPKVYKVNLVADNIPNIELNFMPSFNKDIKKSISIILKTLHQNTEYHLNFLLEPQKAQNIILYYNANELLRELN